MTVHRSSHHTTSRLITQTLNVYARDAAQFLARWGKKRYQRPVLLIEWLKLVPHQATLLDLGCGAGQDARYLRVQGHRVIGLEHSWPLLIFCHRQRPVIPLLCADMRHVPLCAGSLDGIWAAASLIHLPKGEFSSVLTQLRRCLKPNGLFAATLTYGTKSGIRERGWMPGRFFARWSKEELARALRRTGWTVLSVRVVANQERKGRWINVIARRQ